MFRASIARNVRLFSTSARRLEKGPVESAADALKNVDRKVSDAAVSGIEKGGAYITYLVVTLVCPRATLNKELFEATPPSILTTTHGPL